MRKLLLFVIVVIPFIAYAQLPDSILQFSQKFPKYEEYDGSIYLNTKFIESSVIDEATGTFDSKLRYNIYTDAIELKEDSELYEISKRPTIQARIGKNYFYYCHFKTLRGVEKDGYYILIELNDQYRIYKRYEVNIKDPIKMDVYNGNPSPGTIKKIVTYYLEENNIIQELPRDKKVILSSTFEDKQDELKLYIKKEKIKLKKEEDLVRLVAKYNALKNLDTDRPTSMLSKF
ncbi:hypothetical protein [Aquimarina sp. AU474]|uniref:hypothetical protein n=1 Tax=Aquimarina sp. AU474 TaxID=2108529 RepID=UPI000D689C87|nr:hypothetical protein [Aquimarina sp. AU474]